MVAPNVKNQGTVALFKINLFSCNYWVTYCMKILQEVWLGKL